MTKPRTLGDPNLSPIAMQLQERYLPNAFDESLSLLEKINKVIHALYEYSALTQDMLTKWNEVYGWVMEEGLDEAIGDRLKDWLDDGTISEIINVHLFGELKEQIDSKVGFDDFKVIEKEVNEKVEQLTETINKLIEDFNKSVQDLHINVKVYGAKGDNKTDDTKAIQSAINKAHSLGGGKVFVPRGTYLLSEPITIYENIVLDSHKDTVFKRNADYSPMLVNAVLGQDTFYGYEGRGNFQIINGTWDGNREIKTQHNIFGIAHAKDILIQGVTFLDNHDAHHIEINGVKNVKIYDCIFRGHTGADKNEAIQIDMMKGQGNFPTFGAWDSTSCEDVEVRGCLFQDVIQGVGSHVSEKGVRFNSIRIIDNTFENIRLHGLRINTYFNSIISGNTFRDMANGILFDNSVSIAGGSVAITDNTFEEIMKATDDSGNAIRIIGAPGQEVRGLVIANNIISKIKSNGIYATRLRESTISDNMIRECGAGGIRLTTRCESNVVSGNTVIYNAVAGIVLYSQSYYNMIMNNLIAFNGSSGVSLNVSASNNKIGGNFVHSNNQGGGDNSNINIVGSSNRNTVTDNTCYMGEQTNKPRHGIAITSSCVANFVSNNHLYQGGVVGSMNDGGTGTITGPGNVA